MGLKTYIGFALLFLIAVGIVVFSFVSGDYEFKIYDTVLNLPIVAWVLAPAMVLFIFTVLHLMFYGSINYCKNKGVIKDEFTLIEALKSILLGKATKSKFKTVGYKNIGLILNQLSIVVKDSTFTSPYESLNEVVSHIKKIKEGEYVNEKTLKLDKNSELAKQNLINKINEQPDYALDVLKKAQNYSKDVLKVAFLSVLENKTMTTVKKVYSNIKLDRDMALKLFLKDIENKDFGLTKDEVMKITKSLNYTSSEYLTLAKLYKDGLTPDRLLELFETLYEENSNPEVTNAYFYVLCELEMIDKVRDLLVGYDDKELLVFRALLDLKDAGKHYTLEDLNI